MSKQNESKLYKIRLKKGDLVQVLAGKYKGKQGTVTTVHPSENKVTVEGINIVKKHVKPNQAYPQGGIIEKAMPIHVSNVMAYDAKNKKGSRLGHKMVDGKKVRVLRTTGEQY